LIFPPFNAQRDALTHTAFFGYKLYTKTPNWRFQVRAPEGRLYFFLQFSSVTLRFILVLNCHHGCRKQVCKETPDQTPVSSPASTGASASKLNFSTLSEPERDDSGTDIVTNCNFIIESDLFMSLILMIGKCPDCAGSVNIEHKLNDKMGLAQFFNITCSDCQWKLRFCSSKQCEKTTTYGRSGYDINRRTLLLLERTVLVLVVWKASAAA